MVNMLRSFMLRPFVISLITISTASTWAGTACPQHFAGGVPPIIVNPKLQPRTQEVCFEAFAVLHSGLSRTSLYAAEHLVRANLVQAKKLPRRDTFHAESKLPAKDRSELSDYARSGYDRGHLAPNADFANSVAQAESFSLANMVPQVHASNAGVWADIEAVVRTLAMMEGELYVVSGPAFIGGNIKKIGNVLVPTHLWKVIYSPTQRRAGAYIVTNDESRDYSAVSLSDLQKMTGINSVPSLSLKLRDAGMDLPNPHGPNSAQGPIKAPILASTPSVIPSVTPAPVQNPNSKPNVPDNGFNLRDFVRAILEAIERLGKK